MDLNIKNKIALVTGGAQGIGSSISKNLLNEGCTVIITSRNKDAINLFKEDNITNKERLICLETELLDEGSIDFLYSEINDRGLEIDILVNNAGHTMNITDPFVIFLIGIKCLN